MTRLLEAFKKHAEWFRFRAEDKKWVKVEKGRSSKKDDVHGLTLETFVKMSVMHNLFPIKTYNLLVE